MTSEIVAYVRVSTSSQDTALQLDAVRAAGAVKVFEERASGAQRDRPQLRAALDYCRPGDVLVVHSLSRLSRSLSQLLSTAQDLAARGVELRSLREDIRTDTPYGKVIFAVIGALAEAERDILRERTKAGLEAARKRGRVGGRPKAMDSTKVRTAKALLAAGEMSCSEIARTLGVSLTTLYRAFPAARAGAETGSWAPPKTRRIPPELAQDLTENRAVSGQ